MKLSTKVAYNTIVQAGSKVAATALALVSVAIITRYLGREGFGEYTTVITFLSFFGIIADMGLTLVTVQMISRPGADEERILGNLLGLRLVSAVFFLGLAPVAVLFFPYSGAIKGGVAVYAAAFVFIALNQIMVGLFQKRLRMDRVSIAEVAGRLLVLFGVIAAVRTESGLMGVLAAMVAGSALNFLLHYVFARGFARLKLRFDLAYWRRIIVRSWPLSLTIVFNLIYLKTDTLLLSLLERPTEFGRIAEVGLYGAAYKVIDVLITFPFMFAGIILPILTERAARKDKEGFDKVLQKSFNVMAILALPLIIGAQFVAREVMALVAGQDFTASAPVLQVLIAAAGLIFLGNMFAHAIIAVEKQKKVIGVYLFTAVTAVIGYLIFIPRFGMFGAAWMTVYSESVVAVASWYLTRKYTGFSLELGTAARALAASLVMGAAIMAVSRYLSSSLAATLPAAIVVYFASLYAIGGIKKQDVLVLLNR